MCQWFFLVAWSCLRTCFWDLDGFQASEAISLVSVSRTAGFGAEGLLYLNDVVPFVVEVGGCKVWLEYSPEISCVGAAFCYVEFDIELWCDSMVKIGQVGLGWYVDELGWLMARDKRCWIETAPLASGNVARHPFACCWVSFDPHPTWTKSTFVDIHIASFGGMVGDQQQELVFLPLLSPAQSKSKQSCRKVSTTGLNIIMKSVNFSDMHDLVCVLYRLHGCSWYPQY